MTINQKIFDARATDKAYQRLNPLNKDNEGNLDSAAEFYKLRNEDNIAFLPLRKYKDSIKELDESEICDCCKGLAGGTKKWPNAMIDHSKTIKHIANLFKVDKEKLTSKIKLKPNFAIEENAKNNDFSF